MIRNVRALRKLELELIRKSKADYFQNLRLVEAMYEEAVLLGAFPQRKNGEDLDVALEIARVINSVQKTS
jgi:hypothetical protein